MSEFTTTFADCENLTILSDKGKDRALEYADRIKSCTCLDHPAQLRYWANELIAFIDDNFEDGVLMDNE